MSLRVGVLRRGRAAAALAAILVGLLPSGLHLAVTAAPAAERPLAVVLELQEPPAITVWSAQRQAVGAAAAAAAAQVQLATIEAAQQSTLRSLAPLGVPILYRTQRVYNGIAILAQADQIAALETLANVKAVHAIVPKTPDDAAGVPYIAAQELWNAGAAADGVPGVRGEGMRIAIIDTGIDYLHTDFGGPGNGYAQNNPTIAGDVAGFPGVKVVGGYDFVGDHYDADAQSFDYQPIPTPDPDPYDCYGHGTHVAGTAAGYGVMDSGATYRGAYDRTTPFNELRISPGAAPLAQLYALKIFGCTGSSDFTDKAIEWAVDPNGDGDFSDHVDVINLSLGSPYGADYDTTAVAADNAAAAGVIVVASAGNSGDTTFSVGAPALADRVIAVAATQYRVASDSPVAGTDKPASFTARGPRRGDLALKPDLAAPGVAVVSAAASTGNRYLIMSGTSMAAPHVSGALALLRELHPSWSVEELKALVMNTAMPLVRTADSLTAQIFGPARVGAGRIDLAAAGTAQAVALNAEEPGRVGISFGAPAVTNQFAAEKRIRVVNFAATPVTYLPSYAPIVDMPGVAVQPTAGTIAVAGGSSGELAIRLTVDAGKMQRSRDTIADGSQNRQNIAWLPETSGQLLLWPERPLSATLTGAHVVSAVATELSGQGKLTFTPADHTLSFTVTTTAAAVDPTAHLVIGLGRPGETGTLLWDLPAANLGTGEPITGTVVLSAIDELRLASGALYLQLDTAAHPDGEVRGQISTVSPVLHLPVYAAPRPAATMASTHAVEFAADGSAGGPLELTGGGVSSPDTAAYPTATLSLASVFELQLSSPNTRPPSLNANATDNFDHADLRYIGVASDWSTQSTKAMAAATIYFGLATYAPWSTPNEVEFDIYLDVDNDGVDDYRLSNVGHGLAETASSATDSFGTVLENLRSHVLTVQNPLNGISTDHFDLNPFHTNVIVLPVSAAALGLTNAHSAFHYYVKTYSIDLGTTTSDYVDKSPVLRYDVATPAVPLPSGALKGVTWPDLPGTALALRIDPAGYLMNPPRGLLILHQHNTLENTAEVVELRYRPPFSMYLPVVHTGQ